MAGPSEHPRPDPTSKGQSRLHQDLTPVRPCPSSIPPTSHRVAIFAFLANSRAIHLNMLPRRSCIRLTEQSSLLFDRCGCPSGQLDGKRRRVRRPPSLDLLFSHRRLLHLPLTLGLNCAAAETRSRTLTDIEFSSGLLGMNRDLTKLVAQIKSPFPTHAHSRPSFRQTDSNLFSADFSCGGQEGQGEKKGLDEGG